MKTIPSFWQVEKAIGPDMSWYLMYQAIAECQEKLHLNYETLDESALSKSLFMYCLEMKVNQALSSHVYKEEVKLSHQAMEEAQEYFIHSTPKVPTLDLSRYLNYLDEWCKSYPDWQAASPVPLANMIIVKKD